VNRIIHACLALVLVFGALAPAVSAASLDVTAMRNLTVLEGGRAKPFDTWAREALLTIHDEEAYHGIDPVEMILSMTFEKDKWTATRLIALSWRPHRTTLNPENDLEKSKKRSLVSFDEMMNSDAFQKMMNDLEHARSSQKDLTDAQKEDSRLYGRVSTVHAIFQSRAFHFIPMAGKAEAAWMAPGDLEGAPIFAHVVGAWKKIGEAFVKRDQVAFDEAVKKFGDSCRKIDEKAYPPAFKLSLEVLYNKVRPFRSAAILYAAVFFLLLGQLLGASLVLLAFGVVFLIGGGVVATGAGIPTDFYYKLPGWMTASVAPCLMLGGLAIVMAYVSRGAKWLRWLAVGLMLTGWVMHTSGLLARVIVSGDEIINRGPISNMFESMIYLGFGAITFALAFSIWHGITYFGMAACAVASVMLISAENSFDPFISPLVPVLRSYWLWIHVQTIMLGYAGISMAIAMGHLRLMFTLSGDAHVARARAIDPILHRAIQLGSACLGTGIVLGGIWADYSWGRYWGWDPKETWSLITFLCYMALLHGRFAGWLSGAGVALGTVLGLFPLLMTYYGVNFLLVGLHSYAGADANAGTTFLDKLLTVPTWLSLMVLFELLLTQICDAILLRDGRLIAGTIVLEACFIGATWGKVPSWLVLVVLAQCAISIVAWKRRDSLLKSGAAARLVMVLGALLLLPGIMNSASMLGAAVAVAAGYAAIAGRSSAGAPAAVGSEADALACGRCANDMVQLTTRGSHSQPEGAAVFRTATYCEPCNQLFCGKCCGLSQTASALSFAKCPECEKKVVWAAGEHVAKVKAKAENQFQPNIA
jgi:cytochrome c-type biogenesis protein CcsB